MSCFNVKITQTQRNNDQSEVMDFLGNMKVETTHDAKYYHLSLEGNIPYLKIRDINEHVVELCFLNTNNILVLKKNVFSDYEHNEQGAKLKLKILLKEKVFTKQRITLIYEIHEQVLLTVNTLEIEVK